MTWRGGGASAARAKRLQQLAQQLHAGRDRRCRCAPPASEHTGNGAGLRPAFAREMMLRAARTVAGGFAREVVQRACRTAVAGKAPVVAAAARTTRRRKTSSVEVEGAGGRRKGRQQRQHVHQVGTAQRFDH